MWEFVDKVVYINLDKRTDRRADMERMLSSFGSKVVRYAAHETNPGFVGCMQSHVGVLELALRSGWKNVLIFEDDVAWHNFHEGYVLAEHLASQPYDVIHFGPSQSNRDVKYDKSTMRLYDGQSASGYLVNNHYIQKLLDHNRVGLSNLINTNDESLFGADQWWKSLMRQDNWYAILPVLVYQKPGFSDIRRAYHDGVISWIPDTVAHPPLPGRDPGLTVNVMGGLGNQLFQLAALTHVAKRTGRKPYIQSLVNPSTHSKTSYWDTVFASWKMLANSKQPSSRISEPRLSYVYWEAQLSPMSNPELNGYFQDWRYVDPDFVAKLRFPDVSSTYPGIKEGIFLHIRGGDYVGNAYHDIGLDAYYQRALAHFPDAHFFVVTNDPEYAKSRPFMQGLNHTLVIEPELETLYLMSQCAGGICANSSFSWWGAYLNPTRKIVMPDRWFADPNLSTVGYYFPGVIRCQV
jgi:glycosyl transferase family 25